MAEIGVNLWFSFLIIKILWLSLSFLKLEIEKIKKMKIYTKINFFFEILKIRGT
jgi:hypothetical protein